MIYDVEMYYSALEEKRQERRQREQLAVYQAQEARTRQQTEIFARQSEFYAKQRADEDLAKIRADSASQVEQIRQQGENQREWWRQEGENRREWTRQQHEQSLSSARINAEWNLECLRQQTALKITQTQARSALDVASEQSSSQLLSMVTGFFLNTLQKDRDDESVRRASLLRLLEKQADLRGDVLKMLIAAILGQSQGMSEAEASDAVSEVLKRWQSA